MKSRASLVLMEQLVMVLVFALAAALCLQVFVRAADISRQTRLQDEAAVLAQNAAELLKSTRGDVSQAQSLSGHGFRLEIHRQETSFPGLGQAKIEVYRENTRLVAITTGWQEAVP